MSVDVDVAIVGAGPAGARAGELLARQGLGVALFDPRAPWEKPCGGGLTAAAFEHVRELSEVLPFARRIDTVRLEAGPTSLDVPLDRPLQVVSRRALGRWQLDRTRSAGAALESVAVRRIGRAGAAGWSLGLADGRRARARFLVGADGAASLVRRVVAPDLPVELAPARLVFAPGIGGTPGTMGLRFYRSLPGYAWDFPRLVHRSIGVGVTAGTWKRARMDRAIDEYWDALGRCTCQAAERAGAVIGTARRLRPGDYAGLGGANYALLGDAAGLADPATGEGILNALRSAGMLAEAWSADQTFTTYPDLVADRLVPEFRVARRVRTVLYGGGLAFRLIRLAHRLTPARALLAAIVNGGNEHDARLARRMLRTRRPATDPSRRLPATDPGRNERRRRAECAAEPVGACRAGTACACSGNGTVMAAAT